MRRCRAGRRDFGLTGTAWCTTTAGPASPYDAWPRQPEQAGQHEDPAAGGENEGADPQALGDPHGDAEPVHCPVPRPEWPQVADRLMGDPSAEHARIPECRRAPQVATGIEVQVLLRVGRHHATSRQQRRDVRHDGERAKDEDPAPQSGRRVGRAVTALPCGHGLRQNRLPSGASRSRPKRSRGRRRRLGHGMAAKSPYSAVTATRPAPSKERPRPHHLSSSSGQTAAPAINTGNAV